MGIEQRIPRSSKRCFKKVVSGHLTNPAPGPGLVLRLVPQRKDIQKIVKLK